MLSRSDIGTIGLSLLAAASAFTTAKAADKALPSQAKYLEACSSVAPGFYRIPGTNTCVKLGLEVTSETKLDFVSRDFNVLYSRALQYPFIVVDNPDISKTANRYSTRVIADINETSVTKTEYGDLTTFISATSGPSTNASGLYYSSQSPSALSLDQAWLKFAGVTAGLHPSYFDYSPGFNYLQSYASFRNVNLLAYTQTFGRDMSLSLSAEDPSSRQIGDNISSQFLGSKFVSSQYGGNRVPELVVQGRYAPSWGMIHAALAGHQISSTITDVTPGNSAKQGYGWAATTAVEYRVKWNEIFGLANPSYGRFLFSGAYTQGAIDYLGIPPFAKDFFTGPNGELDKTSGYSLIGSYEHAFTPQFKAAVTAAYYNTKSKTVGLPLLNTQGMLFQGGVEYMPVAGLSMGVEADYYKDKIQSFYIGVPDIQQKTDFWTGYLYLRRRI